MSESFTLAIDAMGGDRAPDMVVAGLNLAAERHPAARFLLLGDQAKLAGLLKRHKRAAASCTVRHAPDVIANDANVYRQDSPTQAEPVCGAKKGSDFIPNLGYAKDDEYSAWTQYEPFAEIDIRPTEDLLITPGVKYIHWNHSVNAPVAGS